VIPHLELSTTFALPLGFPEQTPYRQKELILVLFVAPLADAR